MVGKGGGVHHHPPICLDTVNRDPWGSCPRAYFFVLELGAKMVSLEFVMLEAFY